MIEVSEGFFIYEKEWKAQEEWRGKKEIQFQNNMVKFFKNIEKAAKKVTKNKKSATKFLKECGIMNKNGKLDKNYKIENK